MQSTVAGIVGNWLIKIEVRKYDAYALLFKGILYKAIFHNNDYIGYKQHCLYGDKQVVPNVEKEKSIIETNAF